jgi:hypothetical protein
MKCGIHPKRSSVGIVFTDGSRSWMKIVSGRRFVKANKAVLTTPLLGGSTTESEEVSLWCRFRQINPEKDPKNHLAWAPSVSLKRATSSS